MWSARLENVLNDRMENTQGIIEYRSDIWEEFVEKGADLEHDRWLRWQKWCHKVLRENCPSPELEKVLERWDKQIATPYSKLSEAEKESDRKETRNYLSLFRQTLLSREQKMIEEDIKRLEGIKRKPQDLKGEKIFCEFAMCEPKWDGNYYTCVYCGIEYIPASYVNTTLQQEISFKKSQLKEIK